MRRAPRRRLRDGEDVHLCAPRAVLDRDDRRSHGRCARPRALVAALRRLDDGADLHEHMEATRRMGGVNVEGCSGGEVGEGALTSTAETPATCRPRVAARKAAIAERPATSSSMGTAVPVTRSRTGWPPAEEETTRERGSSALAAPGVRAPE